MVLTFLSFLVFHQVFAFFFFHGESLIFVIYYCIKTITSKVSGSKNPLLSHGFCVLIIRVQLGQGLEALGLSGGGTRAGVQHHSHLEVPAELKGLLLSSLACRWQALGDRPPGAPT